MKKPFFLNKYRSIEVFCGGKFLVGRNSIQKMIEEIEWVEVFCLFLLFCTDVIRIFKIGKKYQVICFEEILNDF